MKIVFLQNYLGSGGSERVSVVLAEYFNAKQNDVTIITLENCIENYEISKDITLFSLHDYKEKFKKIIALRKMMVRISPDIVISLSLLGAYMLFLGGLLSKYKIVLSQRNDPRSDVKSALHNWLRERAYSKAKLVVFQTSEAAEYFPLNIQKKSMIIPNPLKDNLPYWDSDNHKDIIINYCRLEKQKNLYMLIDAFELLSNRFPTYELHLYGEGSERNSIIEYIQNKKSRDRIYLYPFSKNIHEKVKHSAVYVSTSNYEGISNSMLESLGIGIPVVCTDCPCGGARQFIEDGVNGYLIEVGNTEQLAKRLTILLNDRCKMKKTSSEAIKIREELSSIKIGETWENAIRVLVKM